MGSKSFFELFSVLEGNTWGGFAMMILLDKLADLDCTGPVFDQNLRLLVMPIGTLIGHLEAIEDILLKVEIHGNIMKL